jgi:hypothetical protein
MVASRPGIRKPVWNFGQKDWPLFGQNLYNLYMNEHRRIGVRCI